MERMVLRLRKKSITKSKLFLVLIKFLITMANPTFAPDKNFNYDGRTRFTPEKNIC